MKKAGFNSKIILLFSFLTVFTFNVAAQKVTLTFHNVPFEKVLNAIKQQTGLSLVFSEQLVDVNRNVSINLPLGEVEDALKQLLTGTNLDFEIKNSKLYLIEKITKDKSDTKIIQKKSTGLVTDEKGDPIIGATVVLKGEKTGTITNSKGEYSVESDDGKLLIISFIGFLPREVLAMSNQKIVLLEKTQLLDEVVVVGYGSIKKSDLNASVASIKASEVTIAPSASIETLLQGRVSGLTVINSGNDNPQGGATIRVRGQSSINGSNAPLMVVDGIPMGDAGNMNSINPNIIESIEVLKDASGTAIYGSRGANGVIMITTKDGSKGKPSVWFNSKVGVGTFSKALDHWTDPLKMAQLSNEGYENAGFDPLYVGKKDVNGTYYPSLSEISNKEWPYNTDWTKHIFRTAITQDYNAGVVGGTEKNKYYVSLGYYKGEGMQVGDDYNKLSFDVSYNNHVTNTVTVSTQAGFFKDNRNYNYGMDYTRNPLSPVFNGDGSYYKAYGQDYGNPVMMTNERKNISENMEAYATLKFDWNILKDLKLTSTANVRGGSVNSAYYNPTIYTYSGDLYHGEGGNSNSNWQRFIGDTYLTYDKIFTEKHHFSAMIGTSLEDAVSKGLSISGRGFQSDILQDENLAGADTRLIANSRVESVLLSYFSRINYTLYNRYLFTLTVRTDGSSKFGVNKKWGYFPSGAFSWKISEESFIKDLNFFDQLKFRTSYGISGNQGISPYQSIEQYGTDFYYTNGKEQVIYGPGRQVGREGVGGRYVLWGGMPNGDLGWEKTSQLNIGLDMTIFKGRFDMTVDFYKKNTTDLLRQKFLPPSSSFDRVWVNDGEIDNQGFELSLNSKIITEGDWKLNAGLIFNTNSNKVVSFGSPASSGSVEVNGIKFVPTGGSMLSDPYVNVLAVGYPINSFFGYKVNGIIQTKPNNSFQMTQPGELNYVGLNADGTLDPNARTIIGNPNPKFTASMNFELRHKTGFDFSVLLYTAYGQDIFSTRKLNTISLQDQRWTPENPNNNRPSLRVNRSYYASSWFIEDGSFLRVQNITLGYTLPQKHSRFITSFRPYFTVSNPFTFSKTSEYDPETGENGIGGAAYPKLCSFTTGFEIKF